MAEDGRWPVQLVRPARAHLDSHVAALCAGWSPNTMRPEVADEALAAIAEDPDAYLALREDREGAGPPVELPDGSFVPRLPGFTRWIWDGEFAGAIGVRWQPGSERLPSHVLGHIGYSVVVWKQGRGYATRALALLLPEVRELGLRWVEVTTDVDNVASQRVALANGGELVEVVDRPAALGGEPMTRFRIRLDT